MADQPAHLLARAILPREVTAPRGRLAALLRPLRGGGGARQRHIAIRPATVAEALLLYASAPGLLEGSEADTRVFEGALRTWLPRPVRRRLARLPRPERLERVCALLDHGVIAHGGAEGGPGAQEDPFEVFGRVAWETLALTFAATYHVAPDRVLTATPWALFLLGLLRLEQVTAIQNLNAAEVALLPHAGKEAKPLLADLRRRAAGQATRGAPGEAAPTPEAVVWENLRRLKSLMGSGHDRGSEPPPAPGAD